MTIDSSFWAARWKEGRIGFHEGRPNQLLERHVARLGEHRRILVPLCGKAEDLAFLAGHGHHVIGVELVEDAVRAFFQEHDLEPRVRDSGPFRVYEAGPVALFAGDFFATTSELLGPLDALYDRAALIALPKPQRNLYIAHLRTLLPPTAPGIIVTFEYPEDSMEGPPFSIREPEVRSYQPGREVQLLETSPSDNPRLGPRASEARECAYWVR